MKRIFILFLTLSMVLSLTACGGSEPSQTTAAATPTSAVPGENNGFLIGYGVGDMTPTEALPLQGTADIRLASNGYATYITARCIAVTDEDGTTAIMMAVDAVGINAYYSAIAAYVRDFYKVPVSNFTMSALHQHSTPSPGHSAYPEATHRYYLLAIQAMKRAVDDAMKDRAPATMHIATVETDALSFSRHYIANDPAGSIVTDNHNDDIGRTYGYKGHETEADKEMRLVKFVREDKKDIVVVNFQGHPHMGMNSGVAHADWPAVMREEVEKALDVHAIYFSGAGGNLNSHSRIKSEMEYASDDFRSHGKKAAAYVIGAEGTYTQVNTGKVISHFETNTYKVNHVNEAHLLADAQRIDDLRKTDISAAYAAANEHPEIFSIYHAQYIVTRSSLGETLELTIGAISLGDVAFTFMPYEMFDMNGMELRSGTIGHENYAADVQQENPYAMTLIATMTNGQEGYIPSALGYKNGGYSTDITRFAPGTGEELVTDYLEILQKIHP